MAPTPHQNIYIVGAQCTGKTTLVNALEVSLDSHPVSDRAAIIREVARTVLKEHGFSAHDLRTSQEKTMAFQALILQAQDRAETAALEGASYFISDRSGIDPIVYAMELVGHESAGSLLQSREWLVLRERMQRSIVVVCEPGADWLTDDGVRLMPLDQTEWREIHEAFCNALNDNKIPYSVLGHEVTDLVDRVSFIWSLGDAASSSVL